MRFAVKLRVNKSWKCFLLFSSKIHNPKDQDKNNFFSVFYESKTRSVTFFLTGFYSPYRTLAFLNGLLDTQTFGKTPWLGDQSNARPLPKHRTTQHRNT
jgi:hypothetical protein